MHRETWHTELVLKDSRIRLDVRQRGRRLLWADLPSVGEEGLALRHLLEGLALWQGPPLLVACDVDGLAGAGVTGRPVPGLLVPPSPLVRAWIGVHGTGPGHAQDLCAERCVVCGRSEGTGGR